MVCKYWKFVIDTNKIFKDLFISYKYNGKYENEKEVIFLDQFKLNKNNLFDKIISLNIVKNLKYLNCCLYFNIGDKNKLIFLNCLQSFERLVLLIKVEEELQQIVLVHENIKDLIIVVPAHHGKTIDIKMEIN